MSTRSLDTNISNIKFKNNIVVYENFVKCTIKDYEMNLSYNPTLLSGSQGLLVPFSSSDSGSIFYINQEENYGILKDFVTGSISGSEFSPYVGSIGLYNDAGDLLAIAKMAAPMPLSTNTDMTFLVKYDTKWIDKPFFTPPPSVTPSISITPSFTPSVSISTTPSVTPTVTPSVTNTPTVTPSPSVSGAPPSVTPSVSVTPSISVTPSLTPTVTPSVSGFSTTTELFVYVKDIASFPGNVTIFASINGGFPFDIFGPSSLNSNCTYIYNLSDPLIGPGDSVQFTTDIGCAMNGNNTITCPSTVSGVSSYTIASLSPGPNFVALALNTNIII